MQFLKIKSIKSLGVKPTIDLEVNHSDHNFYAEGLVTSNSHSYSYSAISAISIYLKFNHPKEFYLSLLKMSKHEPDPIGEISKIHKEMGFFGIELLLPSLIKSQIDFSIEGNNIRFGLSSIKGVSEKTIDKLNNFKREHANLFELFEAAKESGLGIGILSALIQAGTLESFNENRPFLVYQAQLWNKLTDKEKRLAMQYGAKFDYKLPILVHAMVKELKDEKGKFLIKESRFDTIKNHMSKYKEIYDKNKECQEFANWWYTKTLLGYSGKSTLINIFNKYMNSLQTINEISGELDKSKCDFVGVVQENPMMGYSKNKTKANPNGSKYAKYIISDESGSMKVLIFNDKLMDCKEINVKLPQENDIVIVRGTKISEDTIFADSISNQGSKIFMSLADIKEAKSISNI